MSIAEGSKEGGVLAKRYPSFDVVGAILRRLSDNLSFYYGRAKSLVYDVVILRMTEKWYRAVLQRLDDGSIVLDVGVGTGGALLRCADLIKAKKLKVVGIDIDAAYVEAGKASVTEAILLDNISIDRVDIYEDKEKILDLAKKMGGTVNSRGQVFDAVYFSGSFSLLPDPVKALQIVSKLLKRNTKTGANGGAIYITQTYQRRTPFFLPYAKPLLKYATTIDFGKLVKEEEVLKIFKESGLEVVEHNVIPESVNNSFQAAYLSILR